MLQEFILDLGVAVTGAQIKAAVEKVAIKLKWKEKTINNQKVVALGQSSINIEQNLILGVMGGDLWFNLEENYNQILIKEYVWGGLVFEIKHDDTATKRELRYFGKKLKEELQDFVEGK